MLHHQVTSLCITHASNIAITLSPLCITHARNIAITHSPLCIIHASNIAITHSPLYTINHPIHDRVTAMQYISHNQPHPIIKHHMSQDRVILQNTGHPGHLMTNPDHLTSPLKGLLTSPLKGPLTSPLTGHPMSHL